MVSTRPLISKSSSPFINPSVTVLITPITIGIIATFVFHCFFNSLVRSRYLSFFSLSFNFTLWSVGTTKFIILQVLFFVDYYKVWSSGHPFVNQNPKGVCACHSPWQMKGCTYTICSYGQISISCTVPSWSLCPPSRVYSYTFYVLICNIRWLCDWWFCLYHHIAYICCFVGSYLFLFWCDWFL